MLTEISTPKSTPNILKQKRFEPIRVPQNNNHNKVTIIHGFKNKLSINPLASKLVVGQKTGNVLSGVTITPVPVNPLVNTNHVICGKLSTMKQMTIAATPKPNAITAAIIPKINSSVTISPPKCDAPLASSTSTLVLGTKDNLNSSSLPRPQIKRIHPIKISSSITIRANSIEKSSDSDLPATNDKTVTPTNQTNDKNRAKRPLPSQERSHESSPSKRAAIVKRPNENVPLNAEFQNLTEACKAAESGSEMQKIVEKLVKYYHRSHRDYVNSKDFRNFVRDVTHHVKTEPSLMYHKLIDLMAEMKTRRTIETNGASDEVEAVAVAPVIDPKEQEKEAKRAKHIQSLSNALVNLQQRIRKSEQAEVDWDDELNSNYIVTEQLKERAYKIYLKLCDLTGESRNAERTVKKPIKFDGTDYKEFNRSLERFINEHKIFPDMFDVLRLMNHCNTKYDYGLDKHHRQSIGK